MKEKYYKYRVGDWIQLLKDEIHDGRKFPAGTKAKILSFPYKVRLTETWDGYFNPSGGYTIYQRFICAKTEDGAYVRPYLSSITKTSKHEIPV